MALMSTSGYWTECIIWLCYCQVLFVNGGLGNILNDGSFEGEERRDDSHRWWVFKERLSMWTVQRGDPRAISVSTARARVGQKSLAIGPYRLRDEKHGAVWVSQYATVTAACAVHVTDMASCQKDPQTVRETVVITFWFIDSSAAKNVSLKLDISYTDNNVMFAEMPVSRGSVPTNRPNLSGSSWTRSCITIASIGQIRALMLHFVAESTLLNSVYIDDVILKVESAETANPGCVAYNGSSQSQRIFRAFATHPAIDNGATITIASQLTRDRLPRLAAMAEAWQGPISVVVLLFCTDTSTCETEYQRLLESYNGYAVLVNHVTLHVIYEDQANRKDGILYPANLLRNIAIAHVETSRVFYLDADIVPGFTQSVLTSRVEKADEDDKNIRRDKSAFIVPLFHSKDPTFPIPTDKEQLLAALKDNPDVLEAFSGVSHGAVRYRQWYTANHVYPITYVEDMEPYFVTSSSSPVLNEMYVGYGRDKCAYSRDLHHENYQFYVLPDLFLVNYKDLARTATIIQRSGGPGLRMFLTVDFHAKDLENNYIRRPRNFASAPTCLFDEDDEDITTCGKHGMASTVTRYVTPRCNSDQVLSESNNHATDKDQLNNIDMTPTDDLNQETEELPLTFVRHAKTKAQLVDGVAKTFGTYVYVEFPAIIIKGMLSIALPHAHPDAVITINPGASEDHTVKRTLDGVFQHYYGHSDLTLLINTARKDNPGSTLFYVDLASVIDKAQMFNLIVIALRSATDSDIILLESSGVEEHLTAIWRLLRNEKQSWRIYTKAGHVILKSPLFIKSPPEVIPEAPALVGLSSLPKCTAQQTSVDVILMTRNRPMQTLAFLESLGLMVTGMSKVWLLARTDNDMLDQAYRKVIECVRLRYGMVIEYIQENGNFGVLFEKILRSMHSPNLVLAVDEVIWVNEVDLSEAACLLHTAGEETASFQFRLGHNLRQSNADNLQSLRFHSLPFTADISIYYPRRLHFDLGYVTNVDGTLVRTRDLLSDLKEIFPKLSNPGRLEGLWLRRNLHVRSRQWHLIFDESRLVNNMALADGRVAGDVITPSPRRLELANNILNDGQKIDVPLFIEEHRHKVRSTHGRYTTTLTTSDCP